MEISRILAVLLVFSILFGCTNQTVEQKVTEEEQKLEEPTPEVKETEFTKFTDDDFSLEYPDWESREHANTSILAIGNALCVLNVDRHDAPITPLFNWIVNATAANENVSLDEVDIDKHSMGFAADFDNITFKAVTSMHYCNHKTYVVLATCAKDYWSEYEDDLEHFTSSVACAREYAEPDYSAKPGMPNLDDTKYGTFIDEDYSAKIPEWNQGKAENETIISLSQGACTVLLNKYNAPSETLYDWTEKYIEENDSLELDSKSSSKKKISYQMHTENFTLHIESKITYCNFQSYNMITICEDAYFKDNAEILEYIGDSPKCAKEYSIAPEIIKVEEAEEIPEEERIVETDVGLEYGINAEAVVSFFNSNPVFVKVMKKYDKVNLRIEGDEDIKLKAKLDDGYIVNVKEGSYSDADFTLTMPLEDALNIFNNADNITVGNILSFIIHVKTDPPEKMNELIKEAFSAA
ncbi:MAG: hypothetical protein ABH983_01695 [Candidatus Micrarchaeota archaeon]